MADNHVLISRITTSQDVEIVDITNISQQYTDLKIVVSMRSTDSAWYDYPQMYLNDDWDNGLGSYTYRRLYTQTNTVYSASGTSMSSPAIGSAGNGATANTFGSLEYWISNYSSTTQYKSISCDAVGANNSSSVVMGINASIRSSNQAISRVVFLASLGYIKAGSSFSLYGIANANTTPTTSPKAFGGDIIKTDGTYWYHAFLSSGSFKPQLNLTADILAVAGGGGSTWRFGGGGGAGGVVYSSTQSLTNGSSYTCAIGAGGAAGGTGIGGNGGNSQFGSLTAAIGGGSAGGSSRDNGNPGGSGGGGGGYTPGIGGSGTSGQGNAGGNGATNVRNGGGGGGAGAVGAVANSKHGGNGGVGISTYSSWGSATSTGHNVSGTYYYAGGGGGAANLGNGGSDGTWDGFGLGGYGGGGNGGAGNNGGSSQNLQAGSSGLANTGGGAGGNEQSSSIGYSGGSGIIIVRYPV